MKQFAGTVNERRWNRPLELIHTDVCGSIEPNAWDGSKYFVAFIDDYTHFNVVYIIEKKSEVLEKVNIQRYLNCNFNRC